MKLQNSVGPGCVDRKDESIVARQVRETILRDTLHKDYGIPWAQIWNKCEALLEDLLCLKQKYDEPRSNTNTNTKLVYSTAQRH